MNLETHLAALAGQLEGKDPRGVRKAKLGSVVLLLKDGAQVQRATVRIQADHAAVFHGAVAGPDEPKVVVRGPSAAWLSFIETAEPERLDAMEFYGDAQVMRTFTELVRQKRSAVTARLGRS